MRQGDSTLSRNKCRTLLPNWRELYHCSIPPQPFFIHVVTFMCPLDHFGAQDYVSALAVKLCVVTQS